MAPGAVMIAMNGILGANSSPFGTPLRDANPGMSPALANMMTNPGAYGGDMRVDNNMGMEAAPLSQQVMPMQNTGGGIGSLLEPIQAHLIQRYNEAKVVPLLNNFERQLMQLGSPQGGMGGYGGEPLLSGPQQEVLRQSVAALRQSLAAQNNPQRATTMGPESFGPPITRASLGLL